MIGTETRCLESTDIISEEELLMTFQVALVGSDGLIVGSDRKIQNVPSRFGYEQFDAIRKFEVGPDGAVICAWSGTRSQGSRIAREVAALDVDVDDNTWITKLNSIAKPAIYGTAQIIVVRKSHPDHIILMTCGVPEGNTSRIEGKICAGKSLAACFLPGNFLEKRPVDELRKLVLMTLSFGQSEAPTEVGCGYDLMILRSDGKIEWEEYTPNDKRVADIRESFERATKSVIYG